MNFSFVIAVIYVLFQNINSSFIDCYFNNFEFNIVGRKYRCQVSNNLNISSPESAQITAVNGVHMTGKSNNDEICFYAYKKDIAIEYFPQGLEKFFTNLTGILILYSQLKEIHQEDLKPYTKLKYLNLLNNNIEVIEDGLFDYHSDIEVIIFEDCKIFHISPTVFDNLSKLTTLYLVGNKCTNEHSKNNRTIALEVIKSVKKTCSNTTYLDINNKLKNLEHKYKNLNRYDLSTFDEEVELFRKEFSTSSVSESRNLKKRASLIISWKLYVYWYKIESLQASLNDSKVESSDLKAELHEKRKIKNHWMIIALGIVCFTQTIVIAMLYWRFVV